MRLVLEGNVLLSNAAVSLRAFQYGVPVTKYDRSGFKPRPRQLLLTNTFAVLVDRTKIKQRLDYSALRGEVVTELLDRGRLEEVSWVYQWCCGFSVSQASPSVPSAMGSLSCTCPVRTGSRRYPVSSRLLGGNLAVL